MSVNADTGLTSSDIHHLCDDLSAAGHTVNEVKVSFEWIMREIHSLWRKTPQEVLESAHAELHKTQRFAWHGDALYCDTVGTHQERLLNIHWFVSPILKIWSQSSKKWEQVDARVYSWNFPEIIDPLDFKYFKFFLEHHDVPEWIFQTIGDISTMIKKALSHRSKSVLGKIEIMWLRRIGPQGFWISKKQYQKFENDTEEKTSIEALLWWYLDKLDGLCAALLEVLQWNRDRIEPLRNYIKVFQGMSDSFVAYMVRDIYFHAAEYDRKFLPATWRRTKVRYLQSFASQIFDINEIISLDGQENIGIDPVPRFSQDEELDVYLEEMFLGRWWRYLFEEWNENALELTEDISLPWFFIAWLASQNMALHREKFRPWPAKKLQKRKIS